MIFSDFLKHDCIANHFEIEHIYPDGVKVYFDLRIQSIEERLLILSMDITKRKIAEEHLKQFNK